MEWYQVLMIILAVFGMNWAMFFFLTHKIEKVQTDLSDRTREIIKEIRDSNLDFHGRLAKFGRNENN